MILILAVTLILILHPIVTLTLTETSIVAMFFSVRCHVVRTPHTHAHIHAHQDVRGAAFGVVTTQPPRVSLKPTPALASIIDTGPKTIDSDHTGVPLPIRPAPAAPMSTPAPAPSPKHAQQSRDEPLLTHRTNPANQKSAGALVQEVQVIVASPPGVAPTTAPTTTAHGSFVGYGSMFG